MLEPGSDADELWTRGAGKKALKDLQRRRRRLAEQGAVEFSIVASPREVRDALVVSDAGSLGLEGQERRAARRSRAVGLFARRDAALGARGQVPGRPADAGRPSAGDGRRDPEPRPRLWKIAFDEEFRARRRGFICCMN